MRSATLTRGTTLVEMMVGLTVFTLILGGLFAALRAAQDTIASGAATSANAEDSAKIAARIKADLEETNIDWVDTAIHGHSSGYDYMTNHQWESITPLRECSSGSCRFNVRNEGGVPTPIEPQVYAGRNYGFYGTGAPFVMVSGEVWKRPKGQLCPLDNSYLYSGAQADLLSLFTPRGPSGRFVTEEYSGLEESLGTQKAADAQGIVVYYPYYDESVDQYQLRRSVVFLQDMLYDPATLPAYDSSRPDDVRQQVRNTTYSNFYSYQSSGWAATATGLRWADNRAISYDSNGDPVLDESGGYVLTGGQPTFVDLMDFGTDGTTDGVPDGSIPLVPSESDAQNDYATAYSYTNQGADGQAFTSSYWYRYKYMSLSSGTKYFYVNIDRATGQINVYLYFTDAGETWYRYAVLAREPEVLCRNLIDMDFSTAVSNPLTTQNPLGVSNASSVRVTLVLTREDDVGGEKRQVHHTVSFEVQPRN